MKFPMNVAIRLLVHYTTKSLTQRLKINNYFPILIVVVVVVVVVVAAAVVVAVVIV